jgi:hypothetical protein
MSILFAQMRSFVGWCILMRTKFGIKNKKNSFGHNTQHCVLAIMSLSKMCFGSHTRVDIKFNVAIRLYPVYGWLCTFITHDQTPIRNSGKVMENPPYLCQISKFISKIVIWYVVWINILIYQMNNNTSDILVTQFVRRRNICMKYFLFHNNNNTKLVFFFENKRKKKHQHHHHIEFHKTFCSLQCMCAPLEKPEFFTPYGNMILFLQFKYFPYVRSGKFNALKLQLSWVSTHMMCLSGSDIRYTGVLCT